MLPIRPWLYIGKYRDTLNPDNLRVNHIQGVLQVEEPQEMAHAHTLYLPIVDGVPLPEAEFWRGLNFILVEHKLGRNVMIACSAAISRCVVFAVAALHESEGLTLLEAYEQILQVHPAALPHPVLWDSLCKLYEEPIPYVEVLKLYNKTAL